MRTVWVGLLVSGMVLGSTCAALASLETDSDSEAIMLASYSRSYADNEPVKPVQKTECRITYQPIFVHAPTDGVIVGVKLVPNLVDC